MMDGSGIIDYIDWLDKSMMFIVRWLYSSRDHSSLDVVQNIPFGCMILYQTWLYDDFVYVVIQNYTIDFPKPCNLLAFWRFAEEQAFSAQAERGQLGESCSCGIFEVIDINS